MFALRERVIVQVDGRMVEGWISGRSYAMPMRYDVETAKGRVVSVPRERIERLECQNQ